VTLAVVERGEILMPLAADSIRRLTRAVIGARVFQGLLFCFVLVHNLSAALRDVGYRNPRALMWLTLGVIVAVGTLGTYYRSRFGRVEPPKRSLSQQVVRGTAIGLLFGALLMAIVVLAGEREDWPALSGARPVDILWLLASTATSMSLANSRGERLGWMLPMMASAWLLVTLVVPAFQPYRAVGHAGMAAALVVTAVQLHLFVVRGFRHAQV
jgi:hypothetical protein